jgi:hypothetical protein
MLLSGTRSNRARRFPAGSRREYLSGGRDRCGECAFRLDLIRGEKQRDGSHVHNQRESHIQSRAHQDSLVLRGRYSVRGRIRVYITAVR